MLDLKTKREKKASGMRELENLHGEGREYRISYTTDKNGLEMLKGCPKRDARRNG